MALFRRRKAEQVEERALAAPGYFTIGGQRYPFGAASGAQITHRADRPRVDGVEGIVEVGQVHSVVSAAVMRRAMITSQCWPTWRDADTGNMFRSRGLEVFEDRGALLPLLKRAEAHVSYAGNAYFWRPDRNGPIRLLQPEHVQVVLGSDMTPPETPGPVPAEYALDAEVIGYVHHPPKREPDYIPAVVGGRVQVGHWRPEPHPASPWLGASWVSSVISELAADIQADRSADKFFEQGATPRLVFTLPNATPEQVEQIREQADAQYSGVENHYRTVFAGGGADVKVVGSKLADLALKEFRGMAETRIAMRSGVPAQMLGIAEGMQGSALTQGNYSASRRQFADAFVAPYLDSLAAALEPLVEPPRGAGRSFLSWDPDRVLLMQEDRLDAAEILGKKMAGIRQAVDAGFDPDTATAAFTAEDLTKLEHTGLASVQLQPDATGGGND